MILILYVHNFYNGRPFWLLAPGAKNPAYATARRNKTLMLNLKKLFSSKCSDRLYGRSSVLFSECQGKPARSWSSPVSISELKYSPLFGYWLLMVVFTYASSRDWYHSWQRQKYIYMCLVSHIHSVLHLSGLILPCSSNCCPHWTSMPL
jgi:hypothetical protein